MTIKAQEGKIFRRISDKMIFSNEIDLGYTYYLYYKKLDEPLLELPEHFEEIDDPNYEQEVVKPLVQESEENIIEQFEQYE